MGPTAGQMGMVLPVAGARVMASARACPCLVWPLPLLLLPPLLLLLQLPLLLLLLRALPVQRRHRWENNAGHGCRCIPFGLPATWGLYASQALLLAAPGSSV